MISENYYIIYEAYQGWNKEIIHCLTYGDVTGEKKGTYLYINVMIVTVLF